MESRNGVFGKERGQKRQEQVQRKKRAGICLPWKVGGQRWGGVLEAPARSKGSVSLGKRAGMPAESQEGTVSGWELGGQATLARG